MAGSETPRTQPCFDDLPGTAPVTSVTDRVIRVGVAPVRYGNPILTVGVVVVPRINPVRCTIFYFFTSFG